MFRLIMSAVAVWLVATAMPFSKSPAHAAIPPLIQIQGVARDGGGSPLADGNYQMQFSIFDDSSSGTLAWSETQASVSVSGGMFSAALGTVAALGEFAFGAADRWIEVSIGANPPLPRIRLATSPYAFRVSTIDGATGGMVSGDVTIAGKASIGFGHTNTGIAAFVAGQGNIASGDWSTVSGGDGNAAHGSHNTIGGGIANITDDYWTTVGGGNHNWAGAGSTIAGGFTNAAGGSYSTIGGGSWNRARGQFAVVAGGGGNAIEDSNSALGDWSAIGGGRRNFAHGEANTVAGGLGNITDDYFSSIGGGNHNWAGAGSTIAGGFINAAGGWYSTIGGGSWNRAWGQFAVVAGGGGELITDSNSAIGNYSTVSGGRMNVASGVGAVVAGGARNTASGRSAFVAGGVDNIALGKLSFAGGRRALAAHIGAFVWADSLIDTVSSPGINTFTVRASGGIWLGTTSTPSIPVDDFLNTSTGAHLTSGGVWTNASDRDAKENFTEVDRDDLLSRIDKLSIMRWNYRAEDDSVMHIGPAAQDFRALFNVGTDDKSISTIDPSGISLAAIQALSEKNERLEREVTELRKQVSEILKQLGTKHE
jgi:hypothetical protein